MSRAEPNPEELKESEEWWRKWLKEYSKTFARAARSFGIEFTTEEAAEMTREDFVWALREGMRQSFLRKMEEGSK